VEDIECFGFVTEGGGEVLSDQDRMINDELQIRLKDVGMEQVVMWPSKSEIPVYEYKAAKLFASAFHGFSPEELET
jgi:hypothetical protein